MKKRIFYSIEVKCKDEDLMHFIELHRPKGLIYEYVEDVNPEIHPLFEDIIDCINPVKNRELLEQCKIKTK